MTDQGELPLGDFDGKTYDPALDGARLRSQLGRTYETIKRGKWWTVKDICFYHSSHYGKVDSESGVGARLRDLRKRKFGGHNVEGRRVGKSAVWEFRLND